MLAIKNLNTLNNNDSSGDPLPQGPGTPSPDERKDEIATERKDESEKEIMLMECEGGTQLSSETEKISSNNDGDDDSTAAISESSSSGHVDNTPGVFTEVVDIVPPPPMNEKNNDSKDTLLVSASKREEGVNVHDSSISPETESVADISSFTAEEDKLQEEFEEKSPNVVVSEMESESANTTMELVIEVASVGLENSEKKDSQPTQNEVALAISPASSQGGETPSRTLAQRMKEMFDSASPDQPSNAFGKNTRRSSVSPSVVSGVTEDKETESPKPASLAKDLKKIFDSPSSDEPSIAFGADKVRGRNSKQSVSSVSDLRCGTDTVAVEKESKAESTKQASPKSVADQMVSMLWASSSANKKSPKLTFDPRDETALKKVVDEKIVQESDHAVIRETVVEEEDVDIEEITLDEEKDDCAVVARDDSFEEIIEEVIIEEDDYQEEISVTTGDELFDNKARVEVSPDFVDMVETGDFDERSYDEITADDWEYEEKTVDENENESKARVEEKEDIATTGPNSETQVKIETTNSENVGAAESDRKEKFDVERKASVDLEHGEKKSSRWNFAVPPQTPPTPKRHQATFHTDSLRVEKLNPRLARDRSATGALAEKLRMFDSPKSLTGQNQPIASMQSWKKSKPAIKPWSDEPNKKRTNDKGNNRNTPVVLPIGTKKVEKMDQNQCNSSEYNEEDTALAEKIISLVKEPGSMNNKLVLAERITSLLIVKSKEGPKLPTLNHLSNSVSSKSVEGNFQDSNHPIKAKKSTQGSLYSTPLKDVKSLSPKIKYANEADAYLNRKNENFMDPGLKQMRKDVKIQKGKLQHVDDPDTIAKRSMRRISIKEEKEKESKEPIIKSSFEKTQKAVNAEEIMARIWPKTQDGGKQKPKACSSPSKVLVKSVTFDRLKMTPTKLGDKLKMFETSPSLKAPPSNSGKESFIKPHKPTGTNSNSVKVVAENGNVPNNARNNQISKETVRRLLSFQRLWRMKKSKGNTVLAEKKVAATQTKAVSPAHPVCKTNANLTENPASASKPDPKATRTPSKSPSSCVGSSAGCYYSLEDLEQGSFDRSVVDMERWEEFLTDESFYKHFGLTKDNFYQQPKWKRDKQKRKVRVAF